MLLHNVNLELKLTVPAKNLNVGQGTSIHISLFNACRQIYFIFIQHDRETSWWKP